MWEWEKLYPFAQSYSEESTRIGEGVLQRPTQSLWTWASHSPTDTVSSVVPYIASLLWMVEFRPTAPLNCPMPTVWYAFHIKKKSIHDAFVDKSTNQRQRSDIWRTVLPYHRHQVHEFNLLWTTASPGNLNENQWGDKLHFPPRASPWLTQVSSSVPSCQSGDAVSLSAGRFDVLNIIINNVFSFKINCFATVSCSLHPKLKHA